jgi:hypothetical protein
MTEPLEHEKAQSPVKVGRRARKPDSNPDSNKLSTLPIAKSKGKLADKLHEDEDSDVINTTDPTTT